MGLPFMPILIIIINTGFILLFRQARTFCMVPQYLKSWQAGSFSPEVIHNLRSSLND